MQIECPEFPPIAFALTERPATIGAFYSTIAERFSQLQPDIDANAAWVEVPFAKRIQNVADAIATIDRIRSEGEGLEDSPEEPSADNSVAHYYLFKEIYVGRRLIRVGGGWEFRGEHVCIPEVVQFKRRGQQSEHCVLFKKVLSRLLLDLEECWSMNKAPNVPCMFELQILGRKLIENGICPEFSWAPAHVEEHV
jgi:hypothetical protein